MVDAGEPRLEWGSAEGWPLPQSTVPRIKDARTDLILGQFISATQTMGDSRLGRTVFDAMTGR